MPLTNDENRDRGLRCIAQLMNLIRPDWDFNGCLAILRRIDANRSLAQIAQAATWFAEHRSSQRTPAMLPEDGAHWRLHEKQDEPALPPPPPRLHGQNLGPIPTRERIREIRQQSRQGALK